jgi:hypothetical protein
MRTGLSFQPGGRLGDHSGIGIVAVPPWLSGLSGPGDWWGKQLFS